MRQSRLVGTARRAVRGEACRDGRLGEATLPFHNPPSLTHYDLTWIYLAMCPQYAIYEQFHEDL